MRDIFGQEVTEAQLVEWDMIIFQRSLDGGYHG